MNNSIVTSSIHQQSNYHISYNRSTLYYNTDTTFIVLENHVFFILCGDHRKGLDAAILVNGIDSVIDYFIANRSAIHGMSEHYMACKISDDIFSLNPTTLEVIGQSNIDKIVNAFS